MCVECEPVAVWPCKPARVRLLEEFTAKDRIALSMYLATAFLRACEDIPDSPAGVLYRQFFGWLR
jgi:hypothetical protein